MNPIGQNIPVICLHFKTTINTVITERYLSVLRFCKWSKLGHHQKFSLFGFEIRVEMSQSILCTNRHNIDITSVL